MKLLILSCFAILLCDTAFATTPFQAPPDLTSLEVENYEATEPTPNGGPFIIRLWDEANQYEQANPTVEVCGETSTVALLNDGVAPDPAANDNQFTGSAVACPDGETPIVLHGPNGESIFETVVSITRAIESPSLNIHVGGDGITSALTSDGPSEQSASIAVQGLPTDNETANSDRESSLNDPTTDKILALFCLGLGLIIGGLIGWKADKSKVA